MSLLELARSKRYEDQKFVVNQLSRLDQTSRRELIDVLVESPYPLIKLSLLRAIETEPIEDRFDLIDRFYIPQLYFAMPDFLSQFAEYPQFSNKALSLLRFLTLYPSEIVRIRTAHALRYFVHDGAEAVIDLFYLLSNVAEDAPRSLLASECIYSITRLALSIKTRRDLSISDDLRRSTFNSIRNYLSLVLRDFPELAEGKDLSILDAYNDTNSRPRGIITVDFHRLSKHNIIRSGTGQLIRFRK